MNDPFVSIITPYYETGDLFTETILSVEKLNYDNFEWIIIDDCSVKYRASDFLSKASKECLKHVRLIQLEENVGPNRARLRGIHQARGEFITFLDSDDIYYPNKLSVQIMQSGENVCFVNPDAWQKRVITKGLGMHIQEETHSGSAIYCTNHSHLVESYERYLLAQSR